MVNPDKPVVWTIGGSDSAGGAGIQADLLSVHDFNVHCCQLVSAVTAQNSTAVADVFPLQIGMLRSQWQTLLSDMPPAVIKIGMVSNNHQIDWLCSAIMQLKHQSPDTLVVWDPVLSASSGAELNQGSLTSLLALAKQADIITPNCQELAILTESVIHSQDTLILAAQQLLAMGTGSHRAVIAKGGHASWQPDNVVDYLVTRQAIRRFVHPRFKTNNQHGTGCTFASALAALLARSYTLEDAIVAALAYVSEGLATSYSLGQGAGPIAHCGWPTRPEHLPVVEYLEAPLDPVSLAFPKCDKASLGLYPVVDNVSWVERLLKAGIKTIQLRIKHLAESDCEKQILQAITLGKHYRAQVFINDYWRLAVKHRAFGVHLGQEDLAQADLEQIAKSGLRLGVSTHGYAEIARVLHLTPSYIALGHIFPTNTKVMPSSPQGIERLMRYVPIVGDIPSVAIGGISAARFESVKACGVNGIAMVTAITKANDPEQLVSTLMEKMRV